MAISIVLSISRHSNRPNPMSDDAPKHTFPLNVVNSTGERLDAQGETVFLSRLLDALHLRMGDDFKRFTFVVHRRAHGELPGRKIALDPGDDERILILLSDECEVFPVECFGSYRAIFRAYGAPPGGASRIHSFPIGYLNAAGLAEPVPFARRTCPVFFSGCLNSSRVDLYKQYANVPWLPKRNLPWRPLRELARRSISRFQQKRIFDDAYPGACIRFTAGFGQGLDPDAYARTLANSKIALCPPGFVSHETIRHWEAMRLGCVVISGILPKSCYYHGSPIIQLTDWSELRPLLDHLLESPAELESLHHATRHWWEQRCSESSVGEYIARVLSK